MSEQAVVLQTILSIADHTASVDKEVPMDVTDIAELTIPQTTKSAGEEDAPPESELIDMEAPFRLVALCIEAGVKFEATRPIIDSLAWMLRPYAHYRPLQAYALAARLDHAPMMSEISSQFTNYNLTIIKERFWQDIGPTASLKAYQLHYARHHHLFKVLPFLLGDDYDAAMETCRCKMKETHRAELLRVIGDWLATPGHDWNDLQLWTSGETDVCTDCTPRWGVMVNKVKDRFKGPDVLADLRFLD